jgi:isopropylmalate/homocitrate/citramalate synthase
MSVANSLAALAAGAEVVHTTVTGIGERAGNTPMEEVALALTMLYSVEHNLVIEEFYTLSRFVRERTGHQIPSNRAVVGEQLFEIESGIIAGWYERCVDDHPTEIFPYHWDVVGQPPGRVVYGKGSGLPSVTIAMKALGMSADDEQLRDLLAAIKERSLQTKGLLPFEEVARLAEQHLKGAG